jgi:hypothetical protein
MRTYKYDPRGKPGGSAKRLRTKLLRLAMILLLRMRMKIRRMRILQMLPKSPENANSTSTA